MSKVTVMTDSNSGITQSQAKELGITVVPMPFYIDGKLYYEDIDLTQEDFYRMLEKGGDISTSMPAVGDLIDRWEALLKDYDEIVYIPMSSGLSSSCATAKALAQDYEGKVFVVDNQRISVTMKQTVFEAMKMAEHGKTAAEIRDILEATKFESTIYIMVDTLTYLKKGGRITPAAAALGTLLKLKPVLQIRGEKLDAFAKARTIKQAKQIMLDAIKTDMDQVLHDPDGKHTKIAMAHTHNEEAIMQFKEEAQAIWPDHDIMVDPLSLSVSCYIGPGALAITCTKMLDV